MLESTYQNRLIRKLEKIFPGCVVLKTDPSYIQGFPDLLILYRDKWAALEVKARRTAAVQPNQAYYIDLLWDMSFSAFIYPENEEEVLDGLRQSFEPRRAARLSQR